MSVKKYALSFILVVCGVWALTPFTAAAFTKIVGGNPHFLINGRGWWLWLEMDLTIIMDSFVEAA
jgi:hypothetical protein